MKTIGIACGLLAAGVVCAEAQEGGGAASGGTAGPVDGQRTVPAVEVSLPDTLYAVVGDQLQLFYRGMVKARNPYAYDLLVACSNGSQYPRYFDYRPRASEVGSTPFTLRVRDDAGAVLAEGTCTLVTRAAVRSPAAKTHILCVGDSLTSGGVWCQEASRRLTGSGGVPAGLSLSNIVFVGRKKGGGIGWEGTGGWTISSYVSSGGPAYVLAVSNVAVPPGFRSVYTCGGKSYTVAEINLTDGAGTVRFTGPGEAPAAPGVLTKAEGAGDDTLAFASCAAEARNPFWNAAANRLDIKAYADRYCGGALDAVYVLLSWNGQTPFRTDFTNTLAETRTLFDHIHAVYPKAKIKLMGVQLPSLNGGMGANYGAAGTSYSDTYGMVVTVFNMNRAYQEFAREPGYSDFVEFVNISAQFDSENNMPEREVPVNSRSTKTERRGANGVHPSPEGYYQIADAVFRNVVAHFCQ